MGVITASNKSNGASPLERAHFPVGKIIVFVGIFPIASGTEPSSDCSMQRLNALPLPGRARLFLLCGQPASHPPHSSRSGTEDFRRSFRILPVGRFFVGGKRRNASGPFAAHRRCLAGPICRQPDIARMRERPPMPVTQTHWPRSPIGRE